MTDRMIAKLCYTIVHDFQEQIIIEGRAEVRYDYDPEDRYREMVAGIIEWAKRADFPTIQHHAERTLELIDAPTFDPLVDI